MASPVVLFALVFGFMLVEARWASQNERAQRACGGIEPDGDVYALMKWTYPGIFLAMFAEHVIHPAHLHPERVAAAFALFACAKSLKWWAITSLGASWTFRIIVVPGTSAIVSGPYRFLRHPNYVAVVGEIVGVAAAIDARVSGPLALLLFGALMLRRVAVENRALDAILRRG